MRSMFMFARRADVKRRVMLAGVDRVWMMSNGMTLAPFHYRVQMGQQVTWSTYRVNGEVIHIEWKVAYAA